MRGPIWLCWTLTLLGACAPTADLPETVNDRALKTYIGQMPGMTMGAQEKPGGPMVFFETKRQLSFRVDRVVDGKPVTCGYIGYAAPTGSPPFMPPPPDVIFVFDGTITLGRNLSATQAKAIQKAWCGPDWVEPNTNPWVS